MLLQSVGKLWAEYKIIQGINPYDYYNIHDTGVKSTGWVDDGETLGGIGLGTLKVVMLSQIAQ